MATFDQAFAAVVGEEGGYSANPADPGNWTSGACGSGALHGTKFGISAASYPQADIAGMTLAQAQAIYRRDYWAPIHADELPPPLALLVFDAAVNCGVSRAARWLQAAVGAAPDGRIGPLTLQAVGAHAGQGADLLAEFQAQRLIFMASLPSWATFGAGWARRLCRMPYAAMRLSPGG